MPAKTAAPTRSAPKAILIVEDHPLLRRGLTSLIEGEPDLAVCGEVSTCHAALQALGRSKPVIDALVDAVREGRAPAQTARWGRASLEVCHAILTSADHRQPVTLTRQCGLATEETQT